jgi:hypothetical protein
MGRDGTSSRCYPRYSTYHPYNSKTHPEVNDKHVKCEAFRLSDAYGKCIVVIDYGLRNGQLNVDQRLRDLILNFRVA